MTLLPNEPGFIDEATQSALTEQFLIPVRKELEALFRSLRNAIDPELRQARPVKQGKVYPLGQCLEISAALFKRLCSVDSATLERDAAVGLKALMTFARQGGAIRQVWGDLRGEYFQNALLVGVLYVDVANDTVNPHKPPVEILLFAEAQLTPIGDFHHFSRVAARYWQARVYPNHVLPELAPYCPLISVTAGGFVQFQSASDYMIALAEREKFQPSAAVLDNTTMNTSLFHLLRNTLSPLVSILPITSEQGCTLALDACATAHREQWFASARPRNAAVGKVVKLNRELSRLVIQVQ